MPLLRGKTPIKGSETYAELFDSVDVWAHWRGGNAEDNMTAACGKDAKAALDVAVGERLALEGAKRIDREKILRKGLAATLDINLYGVDDILIAHRVVNAVA